MPTYDAPKPLSDLLLAEVHPGWSNATAPFAAGAVYPQGTVLALVSGKYQALDPASTVVAKKSRAVCIAASLSIDTSALPAARVYGGSSLASRLNGMYDGSLSVTT